MLESVFILATSRSTALGIFGLNEDINMKNKENSKVSIDRKERFVQYNAEKIGIQITQKF